MRLIFTMKFKYPRIGSGEVGTTREVFRFLWFPVIIKGEFRWLESCVILERLEYTDSFMSCLFDFDKEWKPVKFIGDTDGR